MPPYKHKISKSRFVSGMQCEKKLYFDLYRSDLKPAVPDEQEVLFEIGNEIGALAHKRFPNGKDATPESYNDFSNAIEQTRQWIAAGESTIYEAAFFHNEVLAALDIWHKHNDEQWAIEVKSSTSVKDYHLTDAALQYWVMTQSGYKPDKFFLMHIDNNYVRQGELDVMAFFKLEDLTERLIAMQDWVGESLTRLLALDANQEPAITIGKHCSAPFTCPYMGHCWAHVPDNSVFELSGARGKDWELYNQGVLSLTQIPDDFPLSTRQQIQVNGAKHGHSYIDKDAIKNFVAQCEYPLYFFDFETVFPAVPLLNGTSPFQQIPFQYSLHILDSPSAELRHEEFLAMPLSFTASTTDLEDPRKSLVNSLRKHIGTQGQLIAYNAPFEKNVLRSLAIACPEDQDFIENLLTRFVDLLDVFRSAWYYKPEMGASASIKSVLPAIAPAFSYNDLAISNGTKASTVFFTMINATFDGDEEEKRIELLEYCERDTEGMVIIWKELMSING